MSTRRQQIAHWRSATSQKNQDLNYTAEKVQKLGGIYTLFVVFTGNLDHLEYRRWFDVPGSDNRPWVWPSLLKLFLDLCA